MIADPTCLSLDLTDKHENSSVTHECKLTKNENSSLQLSSPTKGRMAWQKRCLFNGMHHDQTHIKNQEAQTACDKRYKRGLLPYIYIISIHNVMLYV